YHDRRTGAGSADRTAVRTQKTGDDPVQTAHKSARLTAHDGNELFAIDSVGNRERRWDMPQRGLPEHIASIRIDGDERLIQESREHQSAPGCQRGSYRWRCFAVSPAQFHGVQINGL